MASLLDVLTAARAVRDAIAAGEVANAWEATFPLQQFAIDAMRASGLHALPSAADADTKAQIAACIAECETLASQPPEAAAARGRIFPGDGSVLKLVLDLLKTVLPLVL